jgi:alpha-galactosidase
MFRHPCNLRKSILSLVSAVLIFSAVCVASSEQLIQKFQSGASFSFIYGGKPSHDFLSSWSKSQTRRTLPDGRTLVTTTYRDPGTHLEVTREATLFPGGNAIEWFMTLHNQGSKDTPILEKILPLDAEISLASSDAVTFHHVYGSASDARDYLPLDKDLGANTSVAIKHYVLVNGEHKDSYLPYFNLQWSSGGLVGAVGWTGQWLVDVARNSEGVALQSGQETTHLTLHAGEKIRTPRILLVSWSGKDRIVGQNALRRLLISYYAARVQGEVAMPPVSHTGAYVLIFDDIAKKTGQNPLDILPTITQQDLGGQGGRGFADPGDALNYTTGKNQLELIHNLPPVGIEAYWLDAGWFGGGWPYGVGNWDADPQKFPEGMKVLGDAAHEKGAKFLLWFEPGRVGPDSVIAKEHPNWVLHQPKEGKLGGIFRYGDPAATQWMTDLLAKRIRDWGVDVFRMDNNINPVPFWQNADAPDRQGITEIRQIEGLYAMWDGLLQQFPHLTIDNANWRITGSDIEALHRTIGSLTRSEVTNGGVPNPIADQAHTAELSMWVPFDANILHGVDPYNFRSTATTGVAIALDLQSHYVPMDELGKAIAELKMLRPYWLGDYYPLTPINVEENVWCGWQFHRSDLGGGFAMFFRRPKSTQSNYEASLQGIDPNASYEVSFAESYDVQSKQVMTGEQLSHLKVQIEHAPGSLLVHYQKTTPGH